MKTVQSTIAFLIPFFLLVTSTTVNQCGQGELPPEVEVINCDKPPCVFYIGTNTTMTMKFKSPRYLEHIAPQVIAYLGSLNITYPVDQKDACDGITNTPCPIAAGEYIEYTFAMYVSPLFPTISLTLDFSIIDHDQSDENVECFSMAIQVANPP